MNVLLLIFVQNRNISTCFAFCCEEPLQLFQIDPELSSDTGWLPNKTLKWKKNNNKK